MLEVTGDFQTISVFWPVNLPLPAASLFQHRLFHSNLETRFRSDLMKVSLTANQVGSDPRFKFSAGESLWRLMVKNEEVSLPTRLSQWLGENHTCLTSNLHYLWYLWIFFMGSITIFVDCTGLLLVFQYFFNSPVFVGSPSVWSVGWSARTATDALVEKNPRFQTAFSILFTARRLWELRMDWSFWGTPISIHLVRDK